MHMGLYGGDHIQNKKLSKHKDKYLNVWCWNHLIQDREDHWRQQWPEILTRHTESVFALESILLKPWFEQVLNFVHTRTHSQKHTTTGFVNPAEGDSSVFVALAEAEQKGPGLFFLQQGPCSLPAHKSHDAPETHTQKITRVKLAGKPRDLIPVHITK